MMDQCFPRSHDEPLAISGLGTAREWAPVLSGEPFVRHARSWVEPWRARVSAPSRAIASKKANVWWTIKSWHMVLLLPVLWLVMQGDDRGEAEPRSLLRGDRPPTYVDRNAGAAELCITLQTWDLWVSLGYLPRPAPGFPADEPRWRWKDVDDLLRGQGDRVRRRITDEESKRAARAFRTRRSRRSRDD